MMGFERMAEVLVGYDCVTISASEFLALNVSCLFQVREDSNYCSFSDTYRNCNITKPHLRVAC